jgi:hypothetical protein
MIMSIGEKKKAEIEMGRVVIVKIPKLDEAKRKVEEPPKVNPRVTFKEGIEALKSMPGGLEIVKQLEKEGKKLTMEEK